MYTELVHQKNCKKNLVVTDLHTGEIACSSCGSVSSEKMIDPTAETTGLNSEQYQSNSRVGMKTSLKMADRGLSTIIQSQDRDSTGKSLSNENRRMFYRLRMWDRNSRSAISVKSFQKAFTLLDGIGSKLALPESVIEETAYLFRKIASKKILAGRSTASILCATVYATCRLTDTPRTLQDVADAGNIKKKNLQRIYRFIAKELDLHPEAYNPTEFVNRISKAVNISEKTERLAFKILNLSIQNKVSTSKNPMAMAAAAVNLASVMNHEKVTQFKISEASGISAVTIRDRTKEIKEKIGGEING
ncbi:MAG: transcription factor TFIIB [Nitrosopumilus sp.]|uniref:transcription initiation factor IIB n=1 Tax=Nitrosopumilus sp. TaxID=2024843 RepID=UPI0024701346|nr:transcription factor TFIIB [Nitrosopumilus sp.]MDH5431641.1 transcription factor TFIIB [Nitrosopumilus sp.]